MRGATHDFDPVVLTISAGHFQESVGYFTSRSRGASSWLLIYTVSGSGRFGVPGRSFVSQPGEACLLAPRVPHEYGTADLGSWELLWAHFQPRPHWEALLDWAVVSISDPLFVTRLRETVLLAGLPEAFDEILAMNALEEVLIRGQREANAVSGRGMDPRIRRAVAEASGKRGRGIEVGQLAENAGLSVSRFVRLFREEVGLSPRAYLEVQKINRARELLAMTAMPIGRIAETVGFESEFYFSTRFRKLTGCSPREYRNGPEKNAKNL